MRGFNLLIWHSTKKKREVYYVEVLCVKLRQARGCLGVKSVYSCMEA